MDTKHGQIDLLLVTGPSTGGKTSTLEMVFAQRSQFASVVTTTSRPPRTRRDGTGLMEINGVDYTFRKPEEIIEMDKRHEFFEVNRFTGDYLYGTEKSALQKIWDLHKIPALNVDINGAKAFRAHFPNALIISVMPRTMEELETRMRASGMSEASMVKRLQQAKEDMPLYGSCCNAALYAGTGEVEKLVTCILYLIDGHFALKT